MSSAREAGAAAGSGRFAFGLVLGVVLWWLTGAAVAVDVREAELFSALDRFDAGDRSGAFEALDEVTGTYPNFRAARHIRESLLATGDLDSTLSDLVPPVVWSLERKPTDEAHARLSYWFDRPPPGHLPAVLIEAAPDRAQVVVADAGHSRLYLFDRSGGGWTIRGDWYASFGQRGTAKRREGDRKTPLGVYFVTMWLADRYLPDYFGAGALGLNYPNGWDRSRRRNGYGIWIHGEPRGLKGRAPRWSLGCLMVPNAAVGVLVDTIGGRSVPVIIGERLRWLAPADHERHRSEWLARIASLNGGRGKLKDGLGIYGYPVDAGKESTMVLVEFRAGGEGSRRWWQYWREGRDGGWRIAHEGPAAFRAVHFEGVPPRMPRGGLRRYVP